MHHRLMLTAAVLVGAIAHLAAQNPQQEQPVFRAGSRVEVPIYATVLDGGGRLVAGLEQGDFTVLDNDDPVDLTTFSNAPQPFTAVVMLDTSASMTSSLEFLKRAAEQFLIRLLPTDAAQVGAFNDKIQLSGEFTNDRDALIKALDELQFGNPTRLNDAIEVSLDALQSVDGRRRVVLLFSDGEDTASKTNFKTVLERARDEEVMVYSIGLESEYFNGLRLQRSRPSRDLRRIAEETGGGYFELKRTADLAPTFTRVAQELRSQYLLGFAPATLDGKIHELEVRVRRGLNVRARKSYLATPVRTTSQ